MQNLNTFLNIFENNNDKVVIHSAILGSIERSCGVMMEYFQGFLPL